MKWLRTIVTLLLLAGLVVAVRILTDEKTAIVSIITIVATVAAFSIGLPDSHSIFLAKTQNVPAWGQLVAGITLLILIGKPLAEAVIAVANDFFAQFQGTQCLFGILAIVAFAALFMLDRRRRNRDD